MVRLIVNRPIDREDYTTNYIEAAGLSTDDKPITSLATGSLFLEVDTGDVYAFDEVSTDWTQIAALGGA